MDKRLYEGKRRLQILEANRRYRQNHPEKIASDNKAFREKNPGYSTKWYRENLDKARNGEKLRSKTESYRLRKAAQQTVVRARRSGKLVKPSVCTKCGKSNVPIHGHHSDYSKPLDVQWVCRNCHVEIHYH